MFQIKLTPTAARAFNRLPPELKKQIKMVLKTLGEDPYSGKPLRNELSHFRSLKMKRYRAIYYPEDHSQRVVVVAIGHRRDIYDIATKIISKE